jgi:cardiolipin synthase
MTDSSTSRFNPLRSMPNLLTVSRICLAPFLISATLEHRFRLAFVLFVVAGLTDAFDGALARILRQRSALGQYLDPVADKLLLSALFLVLTHMNLIPTRVTVLVFGRDLGILLVAALLFAAVGRREFKPTVFGKASTVAQVFAVGFVLLLQVDDARWVILSRSFALDATMVLTVASGLHYAWMVSRRTIHPGGPSASDSSGH